MKPFFRLLVGLSLSVGAGCGDAGGASTDGPQTAGAAGTAGNPSAGAGGKQGAGAGGAKPSTAGAGGSDPGAGAGGAGEAGSGDAGAAGSGGPAAAGASGAGAAGAGGSPTAGSAGSGAPGAGAGGQGAGGAGAGGQGTGGQSSGGQGGGGGGAGAGGSGASAGAAGGGGTSAGVPVILIGEITGATDDEVVMINEGVALANQTMATPCFKDFVLSASWTETEGLSQAQIYEKLASGPVKVNIDMFMGTWIQNHVYKTIGYEDEPGTVHMNRYFVDTAYMVADNVIHEAEGHSQGFSHYGVKETSVPYGLNNAFEACSPVGP